MILRAIIDGELPIDAPLPPDFSPSVCGLDCYMRCWCDTQERKQRLVEWVATHLVDMDYYHHLAYVLSKVEHTPFVFAFFRAHFSLRTDFLGHVAYGGIDSALSRDLFRTLVRDLGVDVHDARGAQRILNAVMHWPDTSGLEMVLDQGVSVAELDWKDYTTETWCMCKTNFCSTKSRADKQRVKDVLLARGFEV